MSSIKDRLNEPAPPRPGIGGELGQMRENGKASAEEIRAFLKSVRGKSPQEVLGTIAQSGLAMSILWATIGCAVLLVVFSVIPYVLSGEDEAEAPSAKKAQAEKKEPAEAEQTAQAKPNENETPAGPDPSLPDKLGIGETKASDPKKNPLEGNIDNLLDGID